MSQTKTATAKAEPIVMVKNCQPSINTPSTAKSQSKLNSSDVEIRPESSTNHLSIGIMVRIWQRMGQLYLHKWTTPMGSALNSEKTDLSDTAKVWQYELARSGVTVQKIEKGFEILAKKNMISLQSGGQSWVPDVFEFSFMCSNQNLLTGGAPTLEEVVNILVFLPTNGSLSSRYKHPLAFAIAQCLDMHILRRAALVDAKRTVRPIYDQFIISGWPEFPNIGHHRKFFTLIDVAFDAWDCPAVEYKGESVQKNRDRFRKDLTIMSGFGYPVVNLSGEVRYEAKSINFSKMDQDEFERLYSHAVDVILTKVLRNYTRADLDAQVDRILGFV